MYQNKISKFKLSKITNIFIVYFKMFMFLKKETFRQY